MGFSIYKLSFLGCPHDYGTPQVAFAADSGVAKDTDTFQHLYLGVGALGLSLIFHPNLLLGAGFSPAWTIFFVEVQDTPN